jgi:thioredoxin reductase
VTLLCGGTTAVTPFAEPLTDEDRDRLAAAGVKVDERPVAALTGPGRALEAVEFADGPSLDCGGLLVATTLHQRDGLVQRLGVAYAPANPMTAEAVEVDFMHRTSLEGVAAAGDIVAGPPSVSRAIAGGGMAGAMIVAGLTGAI